MSESLIYGELDVTGRIIDDIRHAFDADGPGVYAFEEALTPGECERLTNELEAQSSWADQHRDFKNQRGVIVQQRFNVFAVKLQAGDQSVVDAMPAVRELANRTEEFIRSLSFLYPMLGDWVADEATAQQYDEGLGLSWHRDNARNIGLIATYGIKGSADLSYHATSGEGKVKSRPGTLVLLRAAGVPLGNKVEYRPLHCVQNATPGRTSLTYRASGLPDQPIDGFNYQNWQPKTSV